jgi:arsenate reductase
MGTAPKSGKAVVLFLCTANACRSQIAQGLLRELAGDRFEVLSAGIDPAPEVHPLAVRVMAEWGVDIARHNTTHAREYLGRIAVRTVIIVCDKAAERCPTTWPWVGERLVWPFEDPAAFVGPEDQRLAKFRAVRDAIEVRLRDWLTIDSPR